MKLNVRLIRKVIKHILAEPARYFQEDVITTGDPGETVWGDDNHRFAKCGTAACIGGWAYILGSKRPRLNGTSVLDKARLLLGLSDRQSQVLFGGNPRGDWPAPYGDAYNNAGTQRGKTRVAARLLEKVIKTKGEILEED